MDARVITHILDQVAQQNGLYRDDRPGYFGGVDADKVIPSSDNDWYKMNGKIGSSAKLAVDYFEEVRINLPSRQEGKLESFPDKIKAALLLVIDARAADMANTLTDKKRGIPAFAGDRQVVTTAKQPTRGSPFERKVFEVDEDATIKAWVASKDPEVDTEAKARALYESAYATVEEKDGYKHSKALAAFETSRDVLFGTETTGSC